VTNFIILLFPSCDSNQYNNPMWFTTRTTKKNGIDPMLCNPIIVNQTNCSIIVFQDRGVLYNKQVLLPGEAMGISKKETVGNIVPYHIHAVVGNEENLPTRAQSAKNLLLMAVIPTAFVAGTLLAASSAGTLAGPSAALGRVATGMVVRGVVIDTAAVTFGAVVASRASTIAEMLIKKHPENFMTKSGMFFPGKRYVVVKGGIEEPLSITTIPEREFQKMSDIVDVKHPMDTMQDKFEYYSMPIRKGTNRVLENVKTTTTSIFANDLCKTNKRIE